jgi:hypothetical protein
VTTTRRIKMLRVVASLAFALGAVLLAGCGDKSTPTPPVKDKKGGDHDHSDHAENVQDATIDGKVAHAILHAHFSADGGDGLEVHFETTDKEPKPATLPEKAKLTATVKQGDKIHELTFTPGDKKERETDPPGRCSLFEAKTPWMRAADKLTVTLTIEGTDKKVVWIDFEPRKHVHKD